MITHKNKRRLNVVSAGIQEEYRKSDAIMAPQVAEANVSCKNGCAACCNQLVSVSFSEMFPIASEHPRLLREKRKQIREQVGILMVLSKQVFGNKHVQFQVNDRADLEAYRQQSDALSTLWWDEKQSCVFLNDDQTCGVYAVRPIACRSHFVSSDPAACKNDADVTSVQFLEMFDLRTRIHDRFEGDTLVLSFMPAALHSILRML